MKRLVLVSMLAFGTGSAWGQPPLSEFQKAVGDVENQQSSATKNLCAGKFNADLSINICNTLPGQIKDSVIGQALTQCAIVAITAGTYRQEVDQGQSTYEELEDPNRITSSESNVIAKKFLLSDTPGELVLDVYKECANQVLPGSAR